MTDTTSNSWVDDVLRFWFEELPEEAWFRKDLDLDAKIMERFLEVHKSAAGRSADDLAASPRRALAAILVLDQFPRNMFRGTSRAFATDVLAREVARAVVDRGTDRAMTKNERLFCYLPFEHSEEAADQVRAVQLISALGDDVLTRYAIAHKVIIDRFGRFPHRNEALGRLSTREELEFLQQPGSSF